jgi:hypothetical protein
MWGETRMQRGERKAPYLGKHGAGDGGGLLRQRVMVGALAIIGIAAIVALTVLLVTRSRGGEHLGGTAVHAGPLTPAELARNAANSQAAGWMSSQDYTTLHAVQQRVISTGTISDADLDWSLALLRRSADPLPRAKVMGMFRSRLHASPSQKERIRAAIEPLLSSADHLDQQYARSAMRGLRLAPSR